jgi:hypothetical protein
MSEAIGRRMWAIAVATSPPGPTGPSPQFTSDETACILNVSETKSTTRSPSTSPTANRSATLHTVPRAGHERLTARPAPPPPLASGLAGPGIAPSRAGCFGPRASVLTPPSPADLRAEVPIVLPRAPDHPSLPGPSLVFPVGEREQPPALALEEGAVDLRDLYPESRTWA